LFHSFCSCFIKNANNLALISPFGDSNVGEGDVVILPAFGASFEEMAYLDKKNVKIIDTTCPWVSKVWNTVDIHQKKGLSSVIHGRYDHEETIATTSFCEEYVCVKNMDEAKYLANYILNGGDKAEFMQKFDKVSFAICICVLLLPCTNPAPPRPAPPLSQATSKNFDPDTHLSKVGLANQTTMYKKETRAIGQLLQKTMMSKFGPDKVDEHYKEFDTICDATQERQDAIHELVENHEQVSELCLCLVLVLEREKTNPNHNPTLSLGAAGVRFYPHRWWIRLVQHATPLGNPLEGWREVVPHQQSRVHQGRQHHHPPKAKWRNCH